MRLAVIGGGPGGLAAAIEAAGRGMATTLFERGRIGENICCAEGFIDTLRVFGEPDAGVRFRVTAIEVVTDRGIEFDASGLNLWMIDRADWQKHLAQKAEQAGVTIRENCRIKPGDLGQLQEEYQYLVDATGVPSVSSLKGGWRSFYGRTGALAAQYVVRGDFRRLARRLKVGIEPHYSGYYWIFPKAADVANIGVLWFCPEREKERGLSIWRELDRVLEKEGLDRTRVLRRCSGICPMEVAGDLFRDGVFLVGDAAGLISPLHGGGIELALISGRLAAALVAAGLPEQYEGRLLSLIGDKLEVERALRDIWLSLTFEKVCSLLEAVARNPSPLGLSLLKNTHLDLVKHLPTVFRFYRGFVRGGWTPEVWLPEIGEPSQFPAGDPAVPDQDG